MAPNKIETGSNKRLHNAYYLFDHKAISFVQFLIVSIATVISHYNFEVCFSSIRIDG
uniref:Uncharacterized protein n=1 Tax=Bartonella rochalimae ATCC BAA-1498 TaxID=685782 RepID=E6YKA4_9HYPH|nr:hypothetical protein BARRO_10225 [Bartonella rochalimae ATCC BAA-1498]